MLSAARPPSDSAHALVALLGMLGLRVSEACNAQVTDLRYAGGYEAIRVLGKGANLPRSRCASQYSAPSSCHRTPRTRPDPAIWQGSGLEPRCGTPLGRVVREACLTNPASPHTLRTFCTAGLISGVPLRDMQYAMRHGVAAYLAGMAIA